jgi:hypothetical protein
MRHARGVVYLVIEEAHELAPKERAGFGAENMAIHWAKKLATAGRSKGIRLIVATQRVQALHNAVLGSCETLIAPSADNTSRPGARPQMAQGQYRQGHAGPGLELAVVAADRNRLGLLGRGQDFRDGPLPEVQDLRQYGDADRGRDRDRRQDRLGRPQRVPIHHRGRCEGSRG